MPLVPRVSFFEFRCYLGVISMCSCESPGRLKSLSTDLDRSDPLFFTSSKCSRKRSSNLRPDSPNVEFAAESTSDAINDVGGCERTCVAAFTRAIETSWF